MTADERLVVEWALWNVRVCDLPTRVQDALHRIAKTGDFPRPADVGGYQPVVARVTAFPADEAEPLRDRWASRPHVGEVVRDLAQTSDAYVLVWFDPDAERSGEAASTAS